MFRKSSIALNSVNTAVLSQLADALRNVVAVRDDILLLEPGDENYSQYLAVERMLRELIMTETLKNGSDIEDVLGLEDLELGELVEEDDEEGEDGVED